MTYRLGLCLSLGLLLCCFVFTATPAEAQPVYKKGTGRVVIYEVYGGGGNVGGLFNADYVVLKNVSREPVSIAGWSLQHAQPTGHFGAAQVDLSGTLAPDGYYLIQLHGGSTPLPDLPRQADATGDINIANTRFKLALVKSTETILNSNTNTVVDFIGTKQTNDYLIAQAWMMTVSHGLQRMGYAGHNRDDYQVIVPNLYYLLPEKNIAEVRASAADEAVRTIGTVTSVSAHEVVLEDHTGGMVMQRKTDEYDITIGDVLDVVGTWDAQGMVFNAKQSTISDATLSLPDPPLVTLEDLVADSDKYDARRVQLQDVVLGRIDAKGITSLTHENHTIPLHDALGTVLVDDFDTVNITAIMRHRPEGYLCLAQPEDITLVQARAHPRGLVLTADLPEETTKGATVPVAVHFENGSAVDVGLEKLTVFVAGHSPKLIFTTETVQGELKAGETKHFSHTLTLDEVGRHDLIIRATFTDLPPYDLSKNIAVKASTVITDHQPPQIHGVRDRRILQHESVDVLAGITAMDDVDGKVPVLAQPSQIDTRHPGSTLVTVTAEDKAGNRATEKFRVTVVKKKRPTYNPMPTVPPEIYPVPPAEPSMPAPEEDPTTEAPVWTNPFSDVEKDAWYHMVVQAIVTNKWMIGTTAHTFSPDEPVTRAMFVAMLHRSHGSPQTTSPSSFHDVDPNDWFAEAVAWAQINGITSGYDAATFGPNDPLTREQLAAFLMKDAKKRKRFESVGSNHVLTADAIDVSAWARESFSWAYANGLLKGRGDHRLYPQAMATRAETAALFLRYQAWLVE